MVFAPLHTTRQSPYLGHQWCDDHPIHLQRPFASPSGRRTGDGDRLAQIVAGVVTNYALDPTGLAQVLIETTSGQSTHYLPGLAQYSGNTWNYSLPDRLGSVRQMVDPSAAVQLARSYDPFGNVLEQTGAGQSKFGYTGEQTDPTGLVFLRARYYNPAVGRFLTADSVVPDPLSSNGWNRYAYAGNNPTRYTDPSGHCIVQYSGEVRMGQAPYGTSGVCSHTGSPHEEAAYAASQYASSPPPDNSIAGSFLLVGLIAQAIFAPQTVTAEVLVLALLQEKFLESLEDAPPGLTILAIIPTEITQPFAGYDQFGWAQRLSTVKLFGGAGECMRVADQMAYSFSDDIYVITNAAPEVGLNPLSGEDWQTFAPRGFHAFSVDSNGNAWDNFGFRGPWREYAQAIKDQNPYAKLSDPFKTGAAADKYVEEFFK
jgi:RHS repeat-associated protein